MKKYFTLFIILGFSLVAAGQQLFVGVGTNWFLPLGKGPYATMHPIHTIDIPLINSSAKYIGGVQISALYTKPLKQKSEIHYKLSFAKIGHWEAIGARDINSVPMGNITYAVNNYCTNLSAALQFNIISKLYFGIGAGLNVSLYNSTSFLGIDYNKKDFTRYTGKTDGTKLNPFIPINIRWQFNKWIIGLDYNQQLLRTHANYGKVLRGINYGVLQFEILRKLTRNKSNQ